MRIISGEFKSRLINVPASKFIRPMTDRVRETLFNLLINKIDFENIKVLDLYSGSGALGLECVSRGALKVHFVEKNFSIFNNLLENINSLGVNDRCTVHKMETIKFVNSSQEREFDLILADPPFFKDDIYKVVESIKANKHLNTEGIMIIERSIQTKEKDIENFKVEPFKIIGDACLYEIK
ncbi:MAG TPA: 16S rRNA (guanine(966)-N(2))-methyltransferase RsmD [Ignavibacteriaceae bacterium]|nr:16S rRNA (guanine(966)-N(2))-methyltransferase RsmD [Ignavibacteriaceae bacterium]